MPWECSKYTDEAQTRCLNAFIEHQREQIAKLEGQLQAQQDMVGQLKGQVDRQMPPRRHFNSTCTQPPVATAVVPPPYVYPYAYAYPPVGFGLYLGRPWGARLSTDTMAVLLGAPFVLPALWPTLVAANRYFTSRLPIG